MTNSVSVIFLNIIYSSLVREGMELHEIHQKFNTNQELLNDEKNRISLTTFESILDGSLADSTSSTSLLITFQKTGVRVIRLFQSMNMLSAPSLLLATNAAMMANTILLPQIESSIKTNGSSDTKIKINFINKKSRYKDFYLSVLANGLKQAIEDVFQNYQQPESCNASIPNNDLELIECSAKDKKTHWEVDIQSNKPLEMASIENHTIFHSRINYLGKWRDRVTADRFLHLKVKNTLIRYLNEGIKLSLEQTAEAHNMSARKLSRKLSEEGYTFQQCMDQCLLERIVHYIQNGFSNKKIAFLLGFRSVTGLNKLLNRKTHTTLNEFRTKLIAYR